MTVLHGFELLEARDIAEINARARLFRHVKSGAQLVSVENNDENKVFGISFRTPPPDSTGIAHIMEHSVLCGSQKYPSKEPFIELVKGSLNTFLNAFTFPDKTCYPVASQNLQDFYNLVDVYVDAVFHPLIPEHTLQQEGWHFELDALDAPLTYKGVVFNEMKGAYSNPDDLLADRARMSLYPDTPYSVDSGGDPKVIPNLTYAQFKDFHQRYYHPSNAYIWFYGDDDPEERLRRMDAYLQPFSAIQVDSAIPLQPRFDAPRRAVIGFDPGDDPESNKARLVVNWLIAENTDPELALGLATLNHILLGTPAAPLRKTLIDSGLGEDITGGGLESELRQSYFSIGLKGMDAAPDGAPLHGRQLETLIDATLRSLAQDGIDPETVAASMNTVEFRLRENNTGSFPRGLSLMLRSLTTWLYDSDPFAPLAYSRPLEAIKTRLASGERYFERLIETFLLNNSHRTVMILQPEPGLNALNDAAEKERLAALKAQLNENDLQHIIENARGLKARQESPDTPEALAAIPRLTLGDLDRENKHIPIDVLDLQGNKVLYHDLFTNGIVYLDLAFDLRRVPQDLLPYVPLFGRALLETGTEDEDFVRLSQRIGRNTGGIRSSTFTSMTAGAPVEKQATAWFLLRGKATPDKASALLEILDDVLRTARLDNRERFRQMVLEEKSDKEAMLVPAGHRVVNARLRSLYNPADWLEEQMYGVSSLFFMRELARQVDADWPSVQANLERLRAIMLTRGAALANITLDAANWARFEPMLTGFLSCLPDGDAPLAVWKPETRDFFEGLAVPSQVNFVGKGADLAASGYTPDGSVSVITNYLGTSFLWEKIRVQGGAYGAFSAFSRRTGVFTFLSYRDPNLLGTLENFDATAGFLKRLDLDEGELTKSIIGAIGDIDAYQLPDAKGFTSMTRYLAGETDTDRQLWREQVLTTTAEDFRRFGETLEALNNSGAVVALGSQEAIEQANAEKGNWLQVKRIL